jgi:hypothetical protein
MGLAGAGQELWAHEACAESSPAPPNPTVELALAEPLRALLVIKLAAPASPSEVEAAADEAPSAPLGPVAEPLVATSAAAQG